MTRVREAEVPSAYGLAAGIAAIASVAAGDTEQARAYLEEAGASAALRGNLIYGVFLPELVRCALWISGPELARRLLDEVSPRIPLNAHALCAAEAALSEAAGDLKGALTRYAEAASRWEAFGYTVERGFALLGRGRCLARAKQPGAFEALTEARSIFVDARCNVAIDECDALLASRM